MTFSILDLTNAQYKANKQEALKRYCAGEVPQDSCRGKGYGKVDDMGYFEYPLPVENGKVVVPEETPTPKPLTNKCPGEALMDFPDFMRAMSKAPFNLDKCEACGGLGLYPIMCCSGLHEQCGCMGLPTNYLPCSYCSSPEPTEQQLLEWLDK